MAKEMGGKDRSATIFEVKEQCVTKYKYTDRLKYNVV